jgi:hypothetical protein
LYPLKEKILNEKGENVVYVDYRERFFEISNKKDKAIVRDREGLGDLSLKAGVIPDVTLE